jgi:hypothetical protein
VSEILSLEHGELPGKDGDEGSRLCDLKSAPIREPGLEWKSNSMPENFLPCSQLWYWKLPQVLDHAPGFTASELSNISSKRFLELDFKDFAETAKGHTSRSMNYFLWTYDLLEWKIYSTFIKYPERLNFLFLLKEVRDTNLQFAIKSTS